MSLWGFLIIKDLESKINFGMNFVVLMSSLPVNMQVQKEEMRDAEWDSDTLERQFVCVVPGRHVSLTGLELSSAVVTVADWLLGRLRMSETRGNFVVPADKILLLENIRKKV
jgi:hypothetical protein